MDVMMQIRTQEASRLAGSLRRHGLPVPDDFAQAVEALARAEDHEPDEGASALEADTVEPDAVTGLIDRIADGIQRRPAIAEARSRVVDRLARRVRVAAAATAPAAVDAFAPVFNTVAEDFVANYRKLPKGWHDADALLEGGPGAVKAYQAAQTAKGPWTSLKASETP